MPDSRHQKLAQVLIQYSLAVKPEDKLLIVAPANAAPLIAEVYREGMRAGAHVLTRLGLNELREIQLKEGTEGQISFVPQTLRLETDYIDAALYILADENTRSLSGIDPKRSRLYRAARKELSTRFDERTAAGELRWCVTLFPTQAYAQDADMSLVEYEDFVFGAGLLNEPDPVAAWKAAGAAQQRIADFLMQHDDIRIVAAETDITYRVGGRTWLNADGNKNFPDGEVFSAPHEDSTNGTVHFTYPALYEGRQVEGVRLTFEKGRVVAASASKGEDFLLTMLDMDSGSRTLGEVAFGTNYGIQRFTGEILFDEKIGGTMHMALGSTYKETGGQNESGLHWDMICDLKQGQVYADGQLIYENGRFLI